MLYRTRAFDDLFGMFDGLDRVFARPVRAALPATYPAVEAFDEGDDLVLRAEIPGVDPGQLEVTVDDGRLILRGEKKNRREKEDGDVYFREVSYGKFERSFGLPEGADADEVKARFENGVLEVRIPVKGLESRSRRIPIMGLPEGKAKGDKAA